MKILHLADLHIGKKVNGFCMIEDQNFVLNQAIELIKVNAINAVFICGDVFDKPIPTIESLELFENFLIKLNELKVKVFIVSGNHDNMDRISYLSKFLENSNIFISSSFDGKIKKAELSKDINIYLMPYLHPALVKKFYPDSNIKNYNDAIKVVVDDIKIDENKVNILLAHQFVIGSNEEKIFSDSEQKSVGGIDEVSYSVFEKFNYTALGHLHCPQKCGAENIYYSGSILKYSFSEINQKKSFRVIEINNKNKISYSSFPIAFLHELKEYRGYIDEFLNKDFYENINTDDYIHFILLDEMVIDAKKKLSLTYPNIMLLEFDNTFTKTLNSSNFSQIKTDKTLYSHFCDFYFAQLSTKIDNDKNKILKEIINEETI